LSFALGRPDTLGADAYHNMPLPLVSRDQGAVDSTGERFEGPECAIINVMVEFSALVRNVSLHIYLSTLSITDKIRRANDIERDLDLWVDTLPPNLRFSKTSAISKSLKSVKDPKHLKLRRLVLQISTRILLPYALASVTNEF
jgi:hypothetical protein